MTNSKRKEPRKEAKNVTGGLFVIFPMEIGPIHWVLSASHANRLTSNHGRNRVLLWPGIAFLGVRESRIYDFRKDAGKLLIRNEVSMVSFEHFVRSKFVDQWSPFRIEVEFLPPIKGLDNITLYFTSQWRMMNSTQPARVMRFFDD